MKPDEIRELTVDDIKARVAELEEERFRLRFRSATEPLDNPLRLRTIRRDIARLKTILGERERGDERQATAAGGRWQVAGGSKKARKKEKSKNG